MDSEAGNTKKATKFASKAFNTVMEALAKEKKESYKPLEEMDLSELPEKLAKFFMIAKKINTAFSLIN